MLNPSQGALVAGFVSSLLYGIYFATLIQCIRWLIFTDEGWNLRQKINPVLTFATIFVFLTSSISSAAGHEYVLDQYIRTDSSWYKSEFGTVMVDNISGTLATQSIDGVLIYRCWVVYAKSWRAICVPATFLLASLVCQTLYCYYAGLNYKGHIYSIELARIAEKARIGLYACNIAITVYTTTAIIYQILSSRRNSGSNHKRLNYVMRILAESGILYTSMVIFGLIATLLATRDNISWVEGLIIEISLPMSFVTGLISFNLILIRVYQSRADRWTESRDRSGEQAVSETQSDNPQTTASNGRRLMRWIKQWNFRRDTSTVEGDA